MTEYIFGLCTYNVEIFTEMLGLDGEIAGNIKMINKKYKTDIQAI